MKKKRCPLSFGRGNIYDCLEEKCALYLLIGSSNKGCCVFLSIAVDLAELAGRK